MASRHADAMATTMMVRIQPQYIHRTALKFTDLRSPLHRATLGGKKNISPKPEKLQRHRSPNRCPSNAHGGTDWNTVLGSLKGKQRQLGS